MENENVFVTGEASKQAFTQIHHADGLVAPIVPAMFFKLHLLN